MGNPGGAVPRCRPTPNHAEIIVTVAVQYYGASKNMGVAAKTLGFLKIRAQGLQILTGPYFFFMKLWSGGVHPGIFGGKNTMQVPQHSHETERSTDGHHVSGVVRASAPLLHIAGTAY